MESFKSLLNEISYVKSVSMDTEIRIADVQEMCRTLQIYDCYIEPEQIEQQAGLSASWEKVKTLALVKEKQLEKKKEVFAQEKKTEVFAAAPAKPIGFSTLGQKGSAWCN